VGAPDFCIDVPKFATTAAGTATLTFVGVGTEVVGTFVGYFAWAPEEPHQAGGSGIT
jgi:hypothetical protein